MKLQTYPRLLQWRFFIILSSLLALLLESHANTFEHPGGLHSSKQISLVREEIAAGNPARIAAFKKLLKQADKALTREPQAPKKFEVPAFYEDPEGHRKAMNQLSEDAWSTYSCAIAYQLSQGEDQIQYAQKSAQFLLSWATTTRRVRGFDGDLAMANAGAGLVFAAELLTDYDGWNDDDSDAVKKWISRVYLTSCEKISGEINNWGDWGLLGQIASHYYLDDRRGVTSNIKNLRKKIDTSIGADGQLSHEVKRGKRGLWYTYFALAPLTAAAEIARNAEGEDLFRYKGKDGAGIEEALDYLFKYCQKPESWPHYQENDLQHPKSQKYPGNLVEAMSHVYGKEAYGKWVASKRPIMTHGHHYAWSVPSLLNPSPLKNLQEK